MYNLSALSRVSSVGIMCELLAGEPKSRSSIPANDKKTFLQSVSPSLGPSQLSIQPVNKVLSSDNGKGNVRPQTGYKHPEGE